MVVPGLVLAGARRSSPCPPVGSPARELLAVHLAVAPDLGDKPFGERVHDRDADAVQAAGDLVAVAAELPAGMELRQDDRQRRQSLLRR